MKGKTLYCVNSWFHYIRFRHVDFVTVHVIFSRVRGNASGLCYLLLIKTVILHFDVTVSSLEEIRNIAI